MLVSIQVLANALLHRLEACATHATRTANALLHRLEACATHATRTRFILRIRLTAVRVA
ncbi:MAG: hypothetical protein F6K37_26020 [Moorea sp. SIO4E2]|uniref:hypothetical protein n=1 Tax=Moorena sp. SIO4E2 TaxID=2607826 RepID=UPI0013BA4334|nr:hypothetical protein [Moorena sp. SIO4E2]NEQ09278.1 hypothetical protein [Moorena sp. SIO4E2]